MLLFYFYYFYFSSRSFRSITVRPSGVPNAGQWSTVLLVDGKSLPVHLFQSSAGVCFLFLLPPPLEDKTVPDVS